MSKEGGPTMVRRLIFAALPFELWAEPPLSGASAFTVVTKRVLRLSLREALAAWWYGVEVPVYTGLTMEEARALDAALAQELRGQEGKVARDSRDATCGAGRAA